MMSEQLEDWLTNHAAVLMEEEPQGEHLDDETLAATMSGSQKLAGWQIKHLAECSECRMVVGELGRAYTNPEIVIPEDARRWTWLWLATPLVAAAVLIVGIRPQQEPTYRSRGTQEILHGEVTFIATDAHGVQRELRAGARLSPSERLGFRYGNPNNAHRQLSIVGWDGKQVHWYYPESPTGTAQTIEDGLNHRLPFDVELNDHTPGNLRLIAVFDLSPQELMARLQDQTLDSDADVIALDVTLESEAP